MIIVVHCNLLFFRWMIVDIEGELIETLILQWPWWNLREAMTRGKRWRIT